jgi:hypothetical protein
MIDPAVAPQRHAHELERAARDDGDDRGADPVEGAPHPREPAVPHVQRGEGEHHQERGQDERDGHQRRAKHARVDPAQVDRELRGERPRRELGEREPLLVVAFRDPAPALDEVALHVAGERDRPAESGGPQVEEVAHERAEAGPLRRGPGHGWGRVGRAGTLDASDGRDAGGGGVRHQDPSGVAVRSSKSVRESALVHTPTLPGVANRASRASMTFVPSK